MAQQSGANSVLLPPGWEAKYNEQAKRYYFIDHATKITQWEDPRLSHPFIWGKPENAQLQQLKITFKEFPELVIREALLKSKFNLREATNELTAMKDAPQGVKPAKTELLPQNEPSSTSTAPKKQSASTPSQSPKPAVKQVDDFAFMSVKSKFPEVPNFIINDVLASFNQNEEKTCKELGSMGYNVKKQTAIIGKFERAEIDKEERAKVTDKQRNEVFNQLKREFSTFPDETIRQVLKKSKFDTVDARSAMRQLESKAKLEELLMKTNPYDDHRDQTVAADSKENSVQSITPSESTRSTSIIAKISSETIETIRHELQQKPKISPDKIQQLVVSSVVSEVSKSPQREQVTRVLGTTLAKGPDPSLRRGPNKTLLAKDSPLAHGPDPLLRHGPCKEFHSGPSFKTHQSLIQ